METPGYVWPLLWVAILGIAGTVAFVRKFFKQFEESIRLQDVITNQAESLRMLQHQVDTRSEHLLRDDVHLYATNIDFSKPTAQVVVNTHDISEAWLQEAYARFRERLDRVRYRQDEPDIELPQPAGPRTRTVQLGE